MFALLWMLSIILLIYREREAVFLLEFWFEAFKYFFTAEYSVNGNNVNIVSFIKSADDLPAMRLRFSNSSIWSSVRFNIIPFMPFS